MNKALRPFAVVLAVLSCGWMYGSLTYFALNGTMLGFAPENRELALWAVFGPGVSGLVLSLLLYKYAAKASKAPPPKLGNLWARNVKSAGNETARE